MMTFTIGLILVAYGGVCFTLGGRMGIDSYLKRARAHVKKHGNKLSTEK